MAHAARASESPLILSTVQRTWRHVAPFVGGGNAPDGRLRAPLGVVLAELENLDARYQPQVTELRVRLYEVLLSRSTETHRDPPSTARLRCSAATSATCAYSPACSPACHDDTVNWGCCVPIQ